MDDVASKPKQQQFEDFASNQKTAADVPITSVIRYDSASGSAKHIARFLDPDHSYSRPFERHTRSAASDIFLDIMNPHYKAFGQTVGGVVLVLMNPNDSKLISIAQTRPTIAGPRMS